MADVFISYKQEDRQRASLVADLLQKAGYSVFFDLNINVGESWDRRIEAELDSASAVVVLWSPLSRESEWVRNEARVGKSNGILCPAVIADTKIPLEFNSIQAANLRHWEGEDDDPEWARLLARVRSCIERRPTYPTADWPVGQLQPPHTSVTYAEASNLLAEAASNLDAPSAYFTILAAAAFADANVSLEESEEIVGLVKRSATFQRFSQAELIKLREQCFAALRVDFLRGVANAAKSLPVEMAETAFANAAGIIMASGRVLARDVTFLDILYKLLGVAQDRATVILDVSRIKALY